MGKNELPRDGQQVIQGQQKGAPQMNHHGLLCRREHRLQIMGCVSTISQRQGASSTCRPSASEMPKSWAKTLAVSSLAAISARTAGGTGVLVQCYQHGWRHSRTRLQGLYQLLRVFFDHEEWIALGIDLIIREMWHLEMGRYPRFRGWPFIQ